mgnify:FL=1
MPEEILSGLGVKVTPANWDTLKLLRSSTPPKPYVVYRIDTDSFIAVTALVRFEKLIPSFDKLDEFKLLMTLGISRNDAYKQVWGDYAWVYSSKA